MLFVDFATFAWAVCGMRNRLAAIITTASIIHVRLILKPPGKTTPVFTLGSEQKTGVEGMRSFVSQWAGGNLAGENVSYYSPKLLAQAEHPRGFHLVFLQQPELLMQVSQSLVSEQPYGEISLFLQLFQLFLSVRPG